MKRLANSLTARISVAGALASAMLLALPLSAQDSRLSLADRVARLEQQAQNKDQGVGLVNQISQLQQQLQQQEGKIEELQHHLQELDDKSKAQYTDLDSRLARLEGGHPGAAAAGAAAAGARANAGSTPQSGAPANAANAVPASSASSASAGNAADQATVQAAYDVAFNSLRSGDYAQASRQFRGFIQQYPNNPLTPNAYYWLGESYYVTMNYSVALEAFQHLVSQFPQSEKAPDALLKVGYSQLELKQTAAATATLTAVTSKYPGSHAASLAHERLQRIQLQSAN